MNEDLLDLAGDGTGFGLEVTGARRPLLRRRLPHDHRADARDGVLARRPRPLHACVYQVVSEDGHPVSDGVHLHVGRARRPGPGAPRRRVCGETVTTFAPTPTATAAPTPVPTAEPVGDARRRGSPGVLGHRGRHRRPARPGRDHRARPSSASAQGLAEQRPRPGPFRHLGSSGQGRGTPGQERSRASEWWPEPAVVPRSLAGDRRRGDVLPRAEHLVDEPVLDGLVGAQDLVALDVAGSPAPRCRLECFDSVSSSQVRSRSTSAAWISMSDA